MPYLKWLVGLDSTQARDHAMTVTQAQAEVWAGHQLTPYKHLYNTAECLVLSKSVDNAKLMDAVNVTIAKTDCLSSFYRQEADGSCRRVRNFDAPVITISELPPSIANATSDKGLRYVSAWAELHDLILPHSLGTSGPYRFFVFSGKQWTILYLNTHHIALDGFGYQIFWQHLALHYNNLVQGKSNTAQNHSFDEVISESNSRHTSPETSERMLELLDEISEIAPARSWSKVTPQFTRPGYEKASFKLSVREWHEALDSLKEWRITWLDWTIAALAQLHHEVTESDQVIIGLPVHNRMGSQAANVACMEMNISPLPIFDVTGNFSEVAQAVSRRRKKISRYSHCRYESLQRSLKGIYSEGQLFGPIVNVLPFNLEYAFGNAMATRHILNAGPVPDIALVANYKSNRESVNFEFIGNKERHSASSLEDFAKRLRSILVSRSDWCAIPRNRIAYKSAVGPVKRSLNISNAIFEIAEKYPSKVAIQDQTSHLTYLELKLQVQRYVSALKNHSLKPGDVVGLALEKSPNAIAAVCAILGGGLHYLPLNRNNHPRASNQLKQMDAAAVIISKSDLYQDWPCKSVIPIEDLDSTILAPLHLSNDDDLAYTMFTSGSTGSPKGVSISHGALNHFVSAAITSYRINGEDRVLQFADLSFDTSIEEVFSTLSSGATLCLFENQRHHSFREFSNFLTTFHVTVIDLPTAYWSEWTKAIRYGLASIPPSIRLVILGGEEVKPEVLSSWFKLASSNLELINSYGPTETTVVATTAKLTADDSTRLHAPIGKPLDGVSYLLLKNNVTDGLELAICGPTLGTKYSGTNCKLRRTADTPDGVVECYPTGDIVEHDATGNLVYVGRKDRMLKWSGMRIEPDLIEKTLIRDDRIFSAKCELIGKNRPVPVLFVAGRCISTQTIFQILENDIPRSSIPKQIVILPSLPKTTSGKIDKEALIKSYEDTIRIPSGSLPTDKASMIRQAWIDELHLENLSETDHFFHLGADSLQAIKLTLKLTQLLGQPVEVSDLYEAPILRDFITRLSKPYLAAPVRLHPRVLMSTGAKQIAFAFPGIGGTSHQFFSLANALGQSWEVVGIDNLLRTCDSEIADQWQTCMQYISLKVTEGPIWLFGHSIGGNMAFEVAKLLEYHNFQVNLCLLDTYMNLPELDDHPESFIDEVSRTIGRALTASESLNIQNDWAAVRYYRASGCFGGNVLRVFAKGNFVSSRSEELMELRKESRQFFGRNPKDIEVSGNHFSIMQEPYVEAIAEVFRNWSREVQYG